MRAADAQRAQDAHATVTSDDVATAVAGAGAGSSSAATVERSATGFYPYEVLRDGVPPGVDASRKESYLSDADFATVFGCTKVRARRTMAVACVAQLLKQRLKRDLMCATARRRRADAHVLASAG